MGILTGLSVDELRHLAQRGISPELLSGTTRDIIAIDRSCRAVLGSDVEACPSREHHTLYRLRSTERNVGLGRGGGLTL